MAAPVAADDVSTTTSTTYLRTTSATTSLTSAYGDTDTDHHSVSLPAARNLVV